MYRVVACLTCGSTDLARTPAVVAPFVSSYALGRSSEHPPEPTDLCRCRICDLTFFDLRLQEDEISRLYAEYRSPAYYRARHRVELFYTRRINNAMGRDDATIDRRRRSVGEFLRRSVPEGLTSILDFGGDAGQFLPDLDGVCRYVYEISEVQPIAGVTRLGSLAELTRPVDLVMLAHVLEHASDPVAMLRELRPLVRDGGYVYVEVPLDRPLAAPEWAQRLQSGWVSAIRRSRRRVVLADTVSTPLRVLVRGRWMPGTFPKLHEHLNYFSERSLREALRQAGWERVASFSYVHGSGPAGFTALGMLGRKRAESFAGPAGADGTPCR